MSRISSFFPSSIPFAVVVVTIYYLTIYYILLYIINNIYYLLADLRYVINESYLKRDCEDDGMSIISKRDNLLIKFFRTRFPNCSDSRVPTHNFHVRVRKFVITLIIPSFVKLLHDPFLALIVTRFLSIQRNATRNIIESEWKRAASTEKVKPSKRRHVVVVARALWRVLE